MVHNIVGPPVRENDLFGREEFVNLLWDRLQTTNILLAAPRRFGKTSVMYSLVDHPRCGYHVIHLDLEKITEPVDFVIELLEKINQDSKLTRLVKKGFGKAGSFFQDCIKSVGVGALGVELKIELKEKIKDNWKEFANQVLSELKDSREKLVFVFDELAVMLENFEESQISRAQQRAFLYWFRDFRQDPSFGLRNCRFLLGSSISIEQHLAARNISAVINDFERIVLPELSPSQERQFVDALSESEDVNISASSKTKMLQLIGPAIPFFVQVFVSEAVKAIKVRHQRIGPVAIDRIYQEEVLGVNCKHYFVHYHERLYHYGEHQRVARQLLRQLCLVDSIPKDQLLNIYNKEVGKADIDGFNRLVSDLENDFYIKCDPAQDSYYFATNILKDWWKRHYVL